MSLTSRRGAFRSLRRLLSGRSPGPFFLGIQLVINSFGEEALRARLIGVIRGDQEQPALPPPEPAPPGHAHLQAQLNETPDDKGRFLRRMVALLTELEPFWIYGYWDYVDDAERAEGEYQGWLRDIQAAIAVEPEELGSEPDGLHRTSADKKYIAVTFLFLLDEPYPAGEIDDEDLFFKRETFSALVHNLIRINPAAIRADAAFIVPGNAQDGLSDDDLLHDDWSYLRELWG